MPAQLLFWLDYICPFRQLIDLNPNIPYQRPMATSTSEDTNGIHISNRESLVPCSLAKAQQRSGVPFPLKDPSITSLEKTKAGEQLDLKRDGPFTTKSSLCVITALPSSSMDNQSVLSALWGRGLKKYSSFYLPLLLLLAIVSSPLRKKSFSPLTTISKTWLTLMIYFLRPGFRMWLDRANSSVTTPTVKSNTAAQSVSVYICCLICCVIHNTSINHKSLKS